MITTNFDQIMTKYRSYCAFQHRYGATLRKNKTLLAKNSQLGQFVQLNKYVRLPLIKASLLSKLHQNTKQVTEKVGLPHCINIPIVFDRTQIYAHGAIESRLKLQCQAKSPALQGHVIVILILSGGLVSVLLYIR